MIKSIFLKIKKIKKWLKQNLGYLILSRLPWQLCNFGFTGRVTIEPTITCNFRCPLCPTSKIKRKRGLLSLENFKKIVDDIPNLETIAMNFAGEPLSDKEIFKMAKYAESKKH